MHEHERKRNALLAPYRSNDDPRFEWLENVFLKYLADWLASIQVRPGLFTPDERAKMFLICTNIQRSANNHQVNDTVG